MAWKAQKIDELMMADPNSRFGNFVIAICEPEFDIKLCGKAIAGMVPGTHISIGLRRRFRAAITGRFTRNTGRS